jgi:negative regulator of flagellin synthesis FlgM
MVNYIGKNQLTDLKVYTRQVSRNRGKEFTAESKSALETGQDRVLLSPAAREIQAATHQLQAIPDIRAEKVAEIKDRIAQGTYQISSEKIAIRLMGESLLNEMV